MQRIAAEEVGEHMMKQIRVFREILAQTPVDQLEVREHPPCFSASTQTRGSMLLFVTWSIPKKPAG